MGTVYGAKNGNVNSESKYLVAIVDEFSGRRSMIAHIANAVGRTMD